VEVEAVLVFAGVELPTRSMDSVKRYVCHSIPPTLVSIRRGPKSVISGDHKKGAAARNVGGGCALALVGRGQFSKGNPMMRSLISIFAATTALALASSALAQSPRGGHGLPPQAQAGTTGAANTGAAPSADARTPTTPTDTTLRGPSLTGQPKVECGSATAPNTPGQSAGAPGSPFNEQGRAGEVYAGEQPQNSRNTASISQYDSACANQPAR
jgi:hypothetical protein